MRVALVTYGLHVGGMESFLLMLADAMRAKGIHVTFIVTEEIGAWHDRARDKGFEIVSIRPSLWRNRRWHTRRLSSSLKHFDVVILNHSAAAQTVVGELPNSCRVITILHNDQEIIYRTGLTNVSNVDHVICVGSKIESEALRRGADPSQVLRIPYGVEVPAVWPKQHERPRDGRPLKIIFVGRVSNAQKGVFDIPLILSEAKRLGAEMTFELVGDGPDLGALQREFRKQIPELDVVFYGTKQSQETAQLMAQADILLMPSRFEGLPITLLEAIAHGVVPIASRLPGVTDDVVTDGLNGILPPVGDIGAFARAIVHLEDDQIRCRMSFAAWQVASRNFTKDAMVNHYLELLSTPQFQRQKSTVEHEAIGRVLFGRSWFLPVGLIKIANAIRSGRLPAMVIRRIARGSSRVTQ